LNENGLMHRDIKPENIMFKDEDKTKIAIIDFGLTCEIIGDETQYAHCGTPGYIAPEVLDQTGYFTYDEKCDVFSAGVILYEMFVKVFPCLCSRFVGQNPFYHEDVDVTIFNNEHKQIDLSQLIDLSKPAL